MVVFSSILFRGSHNERWNEIRPAECVRNEDLLGQLRSDPSAAIGGLLVGKGRAGFLSQPAVEKLKIVVR